MTLTAMTLTAMTPPAARVTTTVARMTMNAFEPVPYRLRWAAGDPRPGAHRGSAAGSGGAFKGFAPLARGGDPRRLDLRASLRDPFETLQVRAFEQRSAVSVYALVDASGSMGFSGSRFSGSTQRMQNVAELCATLAASARASGDAFGLIGCDDVIREELLIPAARLRGLERDVYARLAAFQPQARGAKGLIEAARHFTGRRRLVFVVSDFHMPLADVETLFQALARHDIAPVVIRDPAEDLPTHRWGFMDLTDLETGRARLVFLRPGLREALAARLRAHRARLADLCARYGRPPFILEGRFDPAALAGWLMEG